MNNNKSRYDHYVANLLKDEVYKQVLNDHYGCRGGFTTNVPLNFQPLSFDSFINENKPRFNTIAISSSKHRCRCGIEIEKVIFRNPATIVYWSDRTKTVVKAQGGDIFDKEKGFAMAISKKVLGNGHSYYDTFKKHIKDKKNTQNTWSDIYANAFAIGGITSDEAKKTVIKKENKVG